MRKTSAVLIALFVLIAIPAFASAFSGISIAAAAVSAEAGKAVVNAVPVRQPAEETMKSSKDTANSDSTSENIVIPLGEAENPYIKLVLGRGQNLSYIAWKYTGDADNWVAIAKASGLKTSDSAQRRLFVGTVIAIPQELLKKELLPEPSAKVYNIVSATANRVIIEQIDNMQNSEREAVYWKIVLGTLILILVMVMITAVSARRKCISEIQDLKNQVNNYKAQAKLLPGNYMEFETRDWGVLKAKIIEVVYDNAGRGNPFVIKIECPACKDLITSHNLKSHYSKQHSVAEKSKESCCSTDPPPGSPGCRTD